MRSSRFPGCLRKFAGAAGVLCIGAHCYGCMAFYDYIRERSLFLLSFASPLVVGLISWRKTRCAINGLTTFFWTMNLIFLVQAARVYARYNGWRYLVTDPLATIIPLLIAPFIGALLALNRTRCQVDSTPTSSSSVSRDRTSSGPQYNPLYARFPRSFEIARAKCSQNLAVFPPAA